MDVWCVVAPLLLLLFLAVNDASTASPAVNSAGTRYTYSRDALLQLNRLISADLSQDPILNDLGGDLNFIRRNFVRRKRRKRGRRGGVKIRVRKRSLSRTPLPSMILGNVQSLRNKLDELQGHAGLQKDFKDCCVMAFTETWLTEQDQDNELLIDRFGAPFRNVDTTGKTQGGGVCLYVNNWYCRAVTVREKICTSDVELISVSLRPFYLPREFPQIFITTVYIHPKANAASASSTVYEVIQKLQCISRGPLFYNG